MAKGETSPASGHLTSTHLCTQMCTHTELIKTYTQEKNSEVSLRTTLLEFEREKQGRQAAALQVERPVSSDGTKCLQMTVTEQVRQGEQAEGSPWELEKGNTKREEKEKWAFEYIMLDFI